MKYEATFALKAENFILLERCAHLLDKNMSDMPPSVRRNFAFAFFQGVAETFAIKTEPDEANEAVTLSRDIAIHGPEAVLEAFRRRLAQ